MFEVGDKGRLDYSKFDNVDTDILEALLRADFDAPEAEQMEPEEVLYILKLLTERQENEEAAEQFDVAAAKAEFDEKYYPLLEDEEKLQAFLDDMGYQEESQEKVVPLKPWVKYWRRFASAAAVFLIFMFAGSVTAYALGFDPVKFVGRWNDDQFWYEEELVTTELSDKVAVYSNEIDLVPKTLPENFIFDEVTVFNSESFIKISADFHRQTENGTDKLYIDYMIYLTENRKPFYEKDAEEVNIYVVNNIEHYIMSNLDKTVVTWRNGDVEGSIKGDFSREEAKKMIDSIYGE